MIRFLKWLAWLLKGRSYLTYPGNHCGLCGRWTPKEFSIPEHKSAGHFWDTVGICGKCKWGG